MAAYLRNTAEGQPDGTGLTAANSGGGSGDPFDAVAVSGGTTSRTYSADTFAHGNQSYKLQTATDSNTTITILRNVSGDVTGAISCYVYMPTYADTNCLLMSIMDTSGGTNISTMSVNTDGTVWVSQVGSFIDISPSGTFPTSTWCRIDLVATLGATSSTGRVKAAVTIGDSASPAWSYDSGLTASLGTTKIGSYRWGKLDNTPNIATLYMDDLSSSPGATAFIPAPQPNTSTAWIV